MLFGGWNVSVGVHTWVRTECFAMCNAGLVAGMFGVGGGIVKVRFYTVPTACTGDRKDACCALSE